MLHLSFWNGPGNPYAEEDISVRAVLLPDLEFQKGCIIPGEMLDNQLHSGLGDSNPLLATLMQKALHGCPWTSKLELLSGVKASCVVRAHVKNARLEVFANPMMLGSAPTSCTPS
jgi:hypothetical protein